MSGLQWETEEGLGLLTIPSLDSRAEVFEVASRLSEIVGQTALGPDPKVVIITGTWKGFDGNLEERVPSICDLLARFGPVTLATMDGDVCGHGLEMALSCDLRICSSRTKFSMPQVVRGDMPWDGGTQRLPRLIGQGRAMDMILTGSVVDAQEALGMGLVNGVARPEDLYDEVRAKAMGIAAKAHASLRYVKEAIHAGMDLSLAQGLRLEADLYYLIQTTGDRTEGVMAFREKRSPRFTGQ